MKLLSVFSLFMSTKTVNSETMCEWVTGAAHWGSLQAGGGRGGLCDVQATQETPRCVQSWPATLWLLYLFYTATALSLYSSLCLIYILTFCFLDCCIVSGFWFISVKMYSYNDVYLVSILMTEMSYYILSLYICYLQSFLKMRSHICNNTFFRFLFMLMTVKNVFCSCCRMLKALQCH